MNYRLPAAAALFLAVTFAARTEEPKPATPKPKVPVRKKLDKQAAEMDYGPFLSVSLGVGFSSNIVPEQWRLLYSINPMVGVIDGFRWAILGGNTQFYLPGFLLSLALVAAVFVTGIFYFRKTEKTFADVI